MLCPFTAFFATFYASSVYCLLTYWLLNTFVKQSGKGCEIYLLYFLLSILAWVFVLLLKVLVDIAHIWLKVERYIRYRNNILIGLVFTAVLSIQAKFELIDSTDYDCYFIVVTVSLFAAFYHIFIHNSAKKCEWKPTLNSCYRFLQIVLVFIHVLMTFYEPFWIAKHMAETILLQIALSLICVSSTFSVLAIVMEILKLKEVVPDLESGKMAKMESLGSKEALKDSKIVSVGYVSITPDSEPMVSGKVPKDKKAKSMGSVKVPKDSIMATSEYLFGPPDSKPVRSGETPKNVKKKKSMGTGKVPKDSIMATSGYVYVPPDSAPQNSTTPVCPTCSNKDPASQPPVNPQRLKGRHPRSYNRNVPENFTYVP